MFTFKSYLSIILGFLIFAQSISTLKVGEFFSICKRNDPKLDDCVTNVINKARPLLKTGIKELKVPPLEPMIIPVVKLFRGNGPVSLDSTFMNLKVHGMTNYRIRNLRADLKRNVISFDVEVPQLSIAGDYEVNGRILVLPITGKGDSWSNYTDVSGPMRLIFSRVEKNGQEHLLLKTVKFDTSVKLAKIHMNNLFNGNKELGDSMNSFMSKNWEVVFKELKPVVDEAIAAILTDVGKKVFERFTYDELFPL